MLALAALAGGCAARTAPDTAPVVERYAAAAAAGDSEALYALLSPEAQARYGREGVTALVEASRAELAARAKVLDAGVAETEVRAEVRLADGEVVGLTAEDGAYKLDAAGALPALARTPEQALAMLRAALLRGELAALLPLLGSEARVALTARLGALVRDLESPGVVTGGPEAREVTVELASGAVITLHKENGTWRIDDLE